MQHNSQTHKSEVLAPDFDNRMGCCCDIDGRYAESCWVFHCTIFVSGFDIYTYFCG
jgi:hypothetical protein